MGRSNTPPSRSSGGSTDRDSGGRSNSEGRSGRNSDSSNSSSDIDLVSIIYLVLDLINLLSFLSDIKADPARKTEYRVIMILIIGLVCLVAGVLAYSFLIVK